MTDFKLAPLTPSQLWRMLGQSPADVPGSPTPAAVRGALEGARDKRGNPLAARLGEMSLRPGGVVILNLAMDDPRAPIDAYLAANHPERMALGLALLAEAGACGEALVYAPEELDAGRILAAFKARSPVKIGVVKGPASPVLREDTALYSVLERGEIRSNPEGYEYLRAFPSQGWRGLPTLVADGETACDVACRLLGRDAPPTKLVVINAGEPMLAEVRLGAPAGGLLGELGLAPEKAPLLGGALGRFVAVSGLETLAVAFERDFDSVTLYAKSDCVAEALERMLRETREQSCGKCVMCREGSYHLSQIFSGVTQGKARRDDISLVEDIGPLIVEGALCGFGKKMPLPALTALALHRAEIEAHALKKTCPAKKCAAFLDYLVDPALCTGCGACLDACEDEAIDGRKGFIHVIDAKQCSKCGRCKEVCPEGAVLVGADIRVPRKPIRVGAFNG